MKRTTLFVTLAAIVVLLASQNLTAQAYPVSGYTRIYEGIEYATGYVTSPRLMRAWALRVSLGNPDVSMYASHSNGSLAYEVTRQTTAAFVSEHGLKAAINASFFNAGLSPNTDVWGLLASNGSVVSAPDYAAPFNSYISFTSSKAAIVSAGNTVPAGCYNAVAGAERLLTNGANVGVNTDVQPRTAVGLSSDGKYAIMVCVDGRQPGWSEGVNHPELAQWLLDFGAWNAILLDGGGSTTMVRADIGTVNSPSDGAPRAVGVNLGVSSANVGTVGPSACSMNANRVDLITRGNLNHINLHTWTSSGGWADWIDLAGGTYDTPCIVSRQDGILDAFCRGTDNHLYVKSYSGGSWTGWTSLGGTILSGPAACSRTSGVIDVFARGSDNTIQKITWVSGTGWGAWSSLGGGTYDTVACAAPNSNRVDIFCRGTNNALYTKNWISGVGWSGWINLGGTMTSGPAASSRVTDQIDVAYRGGSNLLYTCSWSSGSGWSAHYNQGCTMASKPGICSSSDSNLLVYFRGTNDHQYQKTWTASDGWSAPIDQGCYY